MSKADAISIGSKVRVTRVRDRIPQAMVDLLKKDANGTVKDFRTVDGKGIGVVVELSDGCLLYTSPSPRDRTRSRMPSSA